MVKYTSKGLKNKKMNADTYALRRKVIDIIYSAKRMVDLPRINVRITESSTDCIGRARIGTDYIIWIPENAFNLSDLDLRQVVLHEILHTAFGVRHKTTGIMTPSLQRGLSLSQIDDSFMQEVKGVLN